MQDKFELPPDLDLALQVREMPGDFGTEIVADADGHRTLTIPVTDGDPIHLGYWVEGCTPEEQQTMDRLLRESVWLAVEYRRLGVTVETIQ